MLRRSFLIVALTLALSGCGTTTDYQPTEIDYPPGAFRNPDGTPKPSLCLKMLGYGCH